MAYNPRMFERVYGYDLLDTIHNFYPEIMYDDVAFPEPMMAWMRHRTSQLFPEQFTHHHNNYRLFQAQNRLTEIHNWRQTRNVSQFSNILQPTFITSIRTEVMPNHSSVPLNSPVEQQNPFVRAHNSNLEHLVSQLLQPINTPASTNMSHAIDLINLFANNVIPGGNTFQDVVVAPTEEEIEEGSVILNYLEIPRDSQCAICQEESGDNSWRRLNCSHYFHQFCVDQWFERDVHCPVCRADIRNNANVTQ